MASESRKKREELKQKYKTHYRKMRQAREQLKQTRRKRNMVEALKDMDSTELMASFDSFLLDVKTKVAHAEARLDLALGDFDDDTPSAPNESETEEAFNRMQARETLKQIKNEMGVLYSEIEQRAEEMDVDKTIGREPKAADDSPASDKQQHDDES